MDRRKLLKTGGSMVIATSCLPAAGLAKGVVGAVSVSQQSPKAEFLTLFTKAVHMPKESRLLLSRQFTEKFGNDPSPRLRKFANELARYLEVVEIDETHG